jgi:hypothetical protein
MMLSTLPLTCAPSGTRLQSCSSRRIHTLALDLLIPSNPHPDSRSAATSLLRSTTATACPSIHSQRRHPSAASRFCPHIYSATRLSPLPPFASVCLPLSSLPLMGEVMADLGARTMDDIEVVAIFFLVADPGLQRADPAMSNTTSTTEGICRYPADRAPRI